MNSCYLWNLKRRKTVSQKFNNRHPETSVKKNKCLYGNIVTIRSDGRDASVSAAYQEGQRKDSEHVQYRRKARIRRLCLLCLQIRRWGILRLLEVSFLLFNSNIKREKGFVRKFYSVHCYREFIFYNDRVRFNVKHK